MPILINWTSPFPIFGLLGEIFHFNSNLKRNFCKETVENLVRQHICGIWSGFALFAMSHKNDARLICAKGLTLFT